MTAWLRFNAVGIMGAGVQLAMLSLLLHFRLNYLIATGLALEAALLHNFVWHRRWTWSEHTATGQRGSLRRFHLSNGLLALISNLLLMRLFAGSLHWPPLRANIVAISLTSLVNFALASRWVFAPRSAGGYDVRVR